MKKLTDQQERFCQEYLADLNGMKAAKRAGYSGDDKSLCVQASRVLRYANVQARLAQLMEERAKRTAITADRVLQETYRIAMADIAQAFDETGVLKPIHQIPEEVRRTISGLEVHELFDGSGDQKHAIGLARKIRFWDKVKALELLGKHLKLFTEKVEHSGKITLEEMIGGSFGGNKDA